MLPLQKARGRTAGNFVDVMRLPVETQTDSRFLVSILVKRLDGNITIGCVCAHRLAVKTS